MSRPTILIPHAPGTNRDGDAAQAVALAGGEPHIRHLNQLRADPRAFREADALLLPGGFSYGDALGAGRRWALDLELFFYDELQEFVESGKRVLGICNGFQVLVKAGLLPGAPLATERGRAAAGAAGAEPWSNRRVTLTHNASGHFECRWVHLSVERGCRAAWLAGIDRIFCPVAHGEGNFQVRDSATLAALEEEGLVAFRYADVEGMRAEERFPLNPNGSVADIAGICNARGNVLGLMPHPENHILAIQSPVAAQGMLGLALFQALVA